MTSGDLPLRTNGHTVTLIKGDTLILFGGEKRRRVAYLDLKVLVWKKIPGLEYKLRSHSATKFESKIYLFGG